MRIGTPELTVEHGQLTWSVVVDGLAHVPDRLWFRLPESHAELATELADPAVIGLFLPAMHADDRIEVDGPVTDELAHNMTHGYQHILEATIPGVRRVQLDAPQAVPVETRLLGVGPALGRSRQLRGARRASLLARPGPPPPQRILTYFNVGSHNPGEEGRRLFRDRFELLASVAEGIGLPFVPVDSNLDDFYTFGSYQLTYGPRNISAASYKGAWEVLLRREASRRDTGAPPESRHGLLRPDLDAPARHRAVPAHSHGNQYTRVEKTLLSADVPASHTSLNVCVTPLRDGGNCSRCPKCLRTELTLEIAGAPEPVPARVRPGCHGGALGRLPEPSRDRGRRVRRRDPRLRRAEGLPLAVGPESAGSTRGDGGEPKSTHPARRVRDQLGGRG